MTWVYMISVVTCGCAASSVVLYLLGMPSHQSTAQGWKDLLKVTSTLIIEYVVQLKRYIYHLVIRVLSRLF